MILNVTARALIVIGGKLLLVSNTGDYWYTPGGRLEPGESLEQCLVREVFEETGLQVEVGNLIHVAEFIEVEHSRHKIECYFVARTIGDIARIDWQDQDGPVEHRRLFTPEEIRSASNVFPSFLGLGTWLNPPATNLYEGIERR
jgi:8-oxo-dGTP pyrophosphatase MutT (NUDIX family)